MAKKNSPLLDLSTVIDVERDYVIIRSKECPDGEPYPIRGKEEISLRNYARLQKEGRNIFSLYHDGDFSGDQLQELVDSMQELLQLVFVDIETEILDKLSDKQQLQILETFINRLTADLPADVKANIEAEKKKIEEEMEPKTEAQKMRATAKKKAS